MAAVVDVLQDPALMREVSLHAMGNFAVQRMLEAAAKVRAAARVAPLQAYEQFKLTHGGKDYFCKWLGTRDSYWQNAWGL